MLFLDPLDGHDMTDISYQWYTYEQAECGEACSQIFVYDKEMSNFDVVEALKTTNKTAYHAGTLPI